MNKPQSGEWWLNDNGERVRIVGWSSNGRLYVEYECGTVLNRKPANTHDWKHLPNCTGWDWQPESEPEWFDLTPFDGHVLRRDIDWVVYTDIDKWQIVGISRGAKIGQVRGYIAKARCLIKDAPPELVAIASKPAEDPDEWVTQDRVPARPLIDERRWVNQREQNVRGFGWVTVGKAGLCDMKHGDVSSGDRLELRCKRRDLPPMPEQSKTETVVFHEFAVKCGHANKNLQLKWRDAKPASNNWIPTGRTETREVVR